MSTALAARSDAGPNIVELDVPASPAYVAVVRTATAGLAARLDLTLDRIEDLRIAVDEACTLLVSPRLVSPRLGPSHSDVATSATGTICCRFTLDDGALTVDITGPPVMLPEPGAYAWAVLSALIDSLEYGQDDGASTWLRLVVRSAPGSWT